MQVIHFETRQSFAHFVTSCVPSPLLHQTMFNVNGIIPRFSFQDGRHHWRCTHRRVFIRRAILPHRKVHQEGSRGRCGGDVGEWWQETVWASFGRQDAIAPVIPLIRIAQGSDTTPRVGRLYVTLDFCFCYCVVYVRSCAYAIASGA
jgi:hypothetical protein